MALSAGATTSGSSFYDRRNSISEDGELGSHIGEGPGSVYSATTEQQRWQLQQQQLQQHQQQHPPMHFSNFSFDQLQVATRNFDRGAVIGQGGFGQVQSNWCNFFQIE